MTAGLVRVLLALTVPDEHAIEHDLYGSGELTIVASATDTSELTLLASAQEADVALVSVDFPGLKASDLMRLHASGCRIAGIALTDAAAAELADLDVDDVLRPPLAPGALDTLLRIPPLVGPASLPLPASGPVPTRVPVAARVSERPAVEREGSLLAVIGSRGSPGASELAASFAALVARDWQVLVAELDGDGGGFAARLEADPREGSLLGLTRALTAGEPNPAALVSHWVAGGSRGWPPVLLAPPANDLDQTDTRTPGVTGRALTVLAGCFQLVVCDVGHRLRRSGDIDPAVRLHRDAIAAADIVLLILGSRQVQLEAGFAQLQLLLDDLAVRPERLRVVVNAQPETGSLRATPTGAAIGEELADRGLSVDAWLPWDGKSLRAAGRLGVPLAVARPRGGYARAVRAITQTVLLPGAPQPAARKHRLHPGGRAVGGPGPDEVTLPWRH